MMSDVLKNDSDSDSLPELSDLLPSPSKEIVKGDIVWARFKKLYWPALVRNVYQKEKKITVWYADDPGKSFKIPLKNVFLFNDREMSTKIKNDVRETGCPETIQAHEGLTSHAITYLNRKAQGCNDDPLKFFDQTHPFFLMEDLLKKNPNAVMDIKVLPMYLDHKVSTTVIRKKRTASEAAAEDSDIESTEDEIESNGGGLSHQYKKNNAKILATSFDVTESEFINEIATCITSGKADVHVTDVISETISSEHHKFYLKSIHTDIRDLDVIPTGPVVDPEKLREIVVYLSDLYVRKFCKDDKKRQSKSSLFHLNDNGIEQARYVKSVWLPESIIFAISEIKGVSYSEAKKLFDKQSEVKSEEIKNIDSLNKNANTSEVTTSTTDGK